MRNNPDVILSMLPFSKSFATLGRILAKPTIHLSSNNQHSHQLLHFQRQLVTSLTSLKRETKFHHEGGWNRSKSVFPNTTRTDSNNYAGNRACRQCGLAGYLDDWSSNKTEFTCHVSSALFSTMRLHTVSPWLSRDRRFNKTFLRVWVIV